MTAIAIVAIVLAAPVILFPVALVWYPTIGGMVLAARERQREKAAAKARA